MSEAVVPSQTVFLGPESVNIVLNLSGHYTLYFNIRGTAFRVLGIDGATHETIMVKTPTAAVDLDWCIKMVTKDLYYGEQLCIYCVQPATALAGELAAAEVG